MTPSYIFQTVDLWKWRVIRPMPALVSTDYSVPIRVDGTPCVKGTLTRSFVFFYFPDILPLLDIYYLHRYSIEVSTYSFVCLREEVFDTDLEMRKPKPMTDQRLASIMGGGVPQGRDVISDVENDKVFIRQNPEKFTRDLSVLMASLDAVGYY